MGFRVSSLSYRGFRHFASKNGKSNGKQLENKTKAAAVTGLIGIVNNIMIRGACDRVPQIDFKLILAIIHAGPYNDLRCK